MTKSSYMYSCAMLALIGGIFCLFINCRNEGFSALAISFSLTVYALITSLREKAMPQMMMDRQEQVSINETDLLVIYLPQSRCNWRSEPVLEAAGNLMEAFGYELEPEESEVLIGRDSGW